MGWFSFWTVIYRQKGKLIGTVVRLYDKKKITEFSSLHLPAMEILNLKNNVTAEQLLRHIVRLGGSQADGNPHIIIPRSTLEGSKRGPLGIPSINVFPRGFIREVPYARAASEYHVTRRGLAFLSSCEAEGQDHSGS